MLETVWLLTPHSSASARSLHLRGGGFAENSGKFQFEARRMAQGRW